ncbi:alpha-glucosidase-like [Hibiscus syriacus]|uniref:Alpha-glucosidase-like n=1 Tax=Hibiscus syriacus TaxID=106335 RepID=A0A6A3BY86_HIBSY|nr:uncharacterized protein LOC120210323 isoform X1 [Hibiscus syriacus]KAE8719982.1 alpha-glucosidase-like [Hibiscus syriacus]
MHLMMMMADQGGNNVVTREYRKGNWSVHETMVLIEAKEMDYKRRMKRSNDGEGRGKPTELRWKWVEDYCGRKGCLRSQNQCNDKWDNLMRDYKKVREYQKRMAADSKGGGSYWEMEKNERKGNNLPSNMLRQIYERLEEVVEKKGAQTVGASGDGGDGGSDPNIPNLPYVLDRPMAIMQQEVQVPIAAATPLSPPPAPPSTEPTAPSPLLQPPPISYAQPLPTVDSDTSEYSDSPAKRRRRRGDNGEGTSGGTGTGANNSNEVSTATAISKSASIIAEAIQASEEREERRHRDLLSFHERRLKIEESKTEISKQGINGLVDAINKLANSILALASHKNQSSAPK